MTKQCTTRKGAEHTCGDILLGDDTYIVHQTNCVSTRAAGLAAQIFRKLPYADCYHRRYQKDFPDTITVRGDGVDNRLIINLHGQYRPGRTYATGVDSAKNREHHFARILRTLSTYIRARHPGREVSVAFPARIGCGLAGGDWTNYQDMINEFADNLRRVHHGQDRVRIYKYSPPQTERHHQLMAIGSTNHWQQDGDNTQAPYKKHADRATTSTTKKQPTTKAASATTAIAATSNTRIHNKETNYLQKWIISCT